MINPRPVPLFFVLMLLLPFVAEGYDFRNYGTENGLSQNTVHRILQDRRGFMWFATKDGLNRFDGQMFRRIDVSEGEPCSFITTLYEDSKGDIWISSNSGPCRYSPATEKMERFQVKTSDGRVITSEINDFLETSDGSLLMATNADGLYSYNLNDGSLKSVCRYRDKGVPHFNRLYQSSGGRIYIGSFGNGLFYTDDFFKNVRPVIYDSGNKKVKESVVYAIKQKGDILYFATDNAGLQALDVRTNSVFPVFTKDENGLVPFVRDINFYNKSEIWMGTETGIYVYDLVNNSLVQHLTHNYYNKFSLSDNAIYCIYTDREGSLWIGSFFGGVNYTSCNRFQFENLFRNNLPGSIAAERIRELCYDNKNNIYVGTEDNGLWCLNLTTNRFISVDGIKDKNIHGLCIDGEELWVGTFSKGLKIKNLSTGDVRELRFGLSPEASRGLNNDFIFTICRTLHGEIYIGTLSGMQSYDRKNDMFVNIPELDGKLIYNIFEDSQGRIWVSTYTEGVYCRSAGSDKWINFRANLDNPDALPSDRIYSVQEDRKHNIWIMTQNGPCIYAEGRFRRDYLNIDRIPGVVYRMVQDELGRYWLTSNHGIYCMDEGSGDIRNFTTYDGLLTNQFNYNSSLVVPEGKVYFGSITGVVSFNPLHFAAEPMVKEKPIISELFVNGRLVKPMEPGSPLEKSITVTDKLNLSSDENSIMLRIASPSFNKSHGLHILYRLEGWDKEWRYASVEDALVMYSNLKHGSYRFEAMLCNDGTKPNGEMLVMEIKIAAPFYLTTWAFIIYISVGIAVCYFSFVYYRRYTRLANQRYLEKFTQEKERETFNSKIDFFTNVAHEIRTPLTLIKAPLDSVFRSRTIKEDSDVKENLDIINLNVDRLLILANQLLDFRKIESGNFKIKRKECDIKLIFDRLLPRFIPTIESLGKKLDLVIPDYAVDASVDSEAITKILSNLFTNAIKYSDSRIAIRLEKNDSEFVFTFVNDGKVVSPEKREEIFMLFSRLENQQQGTGIGLAYARSLAQMHCGSLKMGDSKTENVFVLTIPIGQPEIRQEQSAEDDIESIIKHSGEALNVLLVEDNPEMLAFIGKKLISCNYRVLTASNGIEALNVLKDHYIDIIVTDVMMPVMDGYELLKRIKGDINYSHIPVILLTAKTQMEDKLAGLDAGADAYIEKPFSVEYLLATIGSLLRNRERMRHSLENMPLNKVPTKGLTKVDEEFLQKVNDIIKANFDNPGFSMDDVISTMGMSRTTFYRKIKGMLDLNPNDYIKIQRLKRAAQLFREGHTSVSEVCYMVGFSTPGYFTKCFQKQFGISPKEYIAGKEKPQND